MRKKILKLSHLFSFDLIKKIPLDSIVKIDENKEVRSYKIDEFLSEIKKKIKNLNLNEFREKLYSYEIDFLMRMGSLYSIIIKCLLEEKIISDFDIEVIKEGNRLNFEFKFKGFEKEKEKR